MYNGRICFCDSDTNRAYLSINKEEEKKKKMLQNSMWFELGVTHSNFIAQVETDLPKTGFESIGNAKLC